MKKKRASGLIPCVNEIYVRGIEPALVELRSAALTTKVGTRAFVQIVEGVLDPIVNMFQSVGVVHDDLFGRMSMESTRRISRSGARGDA